MEITLLLAPLVAAFIATVGSKALGDGPSTWLAVAIGLIAMGLSWLLALSFLGGTGPYSVFLGRWIESGSFSAEMVLLIDGQGIAFACLCTALIALAQLYGTTLPTPKALAKAGDSKRLRLQVVLSLLSFALLLFAFAGGLATLFAAVLFLAVAVCLSLDFNFRSKGAGRVAIRALLILLFGGAAVLYVLATMADVADADAFEVVAPVVSEAASALASPGLLAGLAVMAALAFSAALPFYPWPADAGETVSPLAPIVQSLTPGATVLLLAYLSPAVTDATPLWAVALVLASAVAAGAVALSQNDLRRALGAMSLTPAALTLLAALLGGFDVALMVFGVHAIGHLLLSLSYGAVTGSDTGGSADIRQMGGLHARAPTAHFTALLGTLAVTGFGVPILLSNLPLAFSGHVAQGALLTLADQTGPVVFGIVVAALFLQAAALWRLYLRVFTGKSRDKKPAQADKGDEGAPTPMIARVVLVLLALAAVLGGVILTRGEAVPAMFWHPMLACLAGFALALGTGFLPSKTIDTLDPAQGFVSSHGRLEKAFDVLFGAPAAALGTLLVDRIDRGLLERLFAPLARKLLPGLTRRADQAQATRAFPYALGFVVAGALVITLVTMAGG